MNRPFRFPQSARLRRTSDFEQVYRSGTRLKAFPLRVRALKRSSGEARLGLSINSRSGPPVVRNRWKRAIREAFRLHRGELLGPYDLVVSVGWEASPADAERVEEAFLQIVEKLNGRSRAAAGEQSP